MRYAADFETTTELEDCRVWCFGLANIDDPEDFTFGYTIDELIEFCKQQTHLKLYFHNLKFDGEFIIDWLFRNGYEHVKDVKEAKTKSFNTLISDKGLFYSITIYFKVKGNFKHKLTIYDSLKMLPFSVDKIAKTFGIEENKLEMDYKKPRPIGYQMTLDELMYLRNDVVIMAKALKMVFDMGHTKMTQGSNALADYKSRMTKSDFMYNFPIPKYEIDQDIRQSYKGGWTYANEIYREKEVGEGIVLDVNSLYPYVMRKLELPYAKPIFFEGKYKPDKMYPYYVQMFSCQFELKKNHLPTIQIKNVRSGFVPTEYLKTSGNKEVTLCLTNIDFEIFRRHYKIENLEYINGWKFKAKTGLFDEYIDYWTEQKIKAKIEKNDGLYMYAKLMLNALYGKYALNPNVRSKYPYFDREEDRVKYMYGEKETRDPLYIPLGSFVTSHARAVTITASQKLYERFLYADTDSMHLLGTEIPKEIFVHDTELGAWKLEYEFEKARYLRAKAYIDVLKDKWAEHVKAKPGEITYTKDGEKIVAEGGEKKYTKNGRKVINKLKVVCAGMPDTCYKQVTFNNFKIGKEYSGKLVMKHVKGGIVLVDTTYKLKE